MKAISTINNDNLDCVYPCLKKYIGVNGKYKNGFVVLFTSQKEGMVLDPGNIKEYKIGHYTTTWDEQIQFEKLMPEEKVILSN